MVVSIGVVGSASGAADYYAADNYYLVGDQVGIAEWGGKGARTLGLAGPVDALKFERVLDGALPNGDQIPSGADGHRSGIDLTFSAPKSVSLLALVGGDERVLLAHARSVATAMQWTEHNLAEARRGKNGHETVRTGNLVYATFTHNVSRSLDPQLHSHVVVANATQRDDGSWRALKNDQLFKENTLIASIYHAQLRAELSKLGYEDQIRRLVDRYVVGEDVENLDGVLIVNELGNQQAAETWSAEKTRNETDIIRSRVRKTIEQELADDPYAQLFFSDLLRRAIAEASALFDHPYKQYVLFKDLEEKLAAKTVDDLPKGLEGRRHASAYFGIIRLEMGNVVSTATEQEEFIHAALDMEKFVESAIAENSLNPANIEAAIRKALLPRLFGVTGLDKAKVITERIVEVTRVGLARDNGAKT